MNHFYLVLTLTILLSNTRFLHRVSAYSVFSLKSCQEGGSGLAFCFLPRGGVRSCFLPVSKISIKRNYSTVIARSEEDSFALLGTGCAISHSECHCEKRSDAAISSYKDEIATLPSVARNDIVRIYIALI
jgi:hypothetical protein